MRIPSPPPEGVGVLPSNRLMECAAGWGRIFTTGLTIMGLHFYKSYQNGVAHFQDFGGQKIQVSRHLKIERFTPHLV